ncbi:MAG TPA: hypothetical protein VLE21_02715 [Candidatus Nitrosocosmicus sp.]|nr:hypothetical protein [Candidatus Nitrosocosmicus sp.]
MIKPKHQVNSSSSFLFVIMLMSTLLLLLGVGVTTTTITATTTSSSSSPNSQISNSIVSSISLTQSINPDLAFAQSSVATFANSASNISSNSSNDRLVFNNYENSEMGISIKYPSNFLIDESNSNETVKQVSFFPAYDNSSDYPQTYISWFNMYVEELYPPISDNPINISSYLEDQANSIQEEDADVTIVEKSTDSILSEFPAYKLVTRSYAGNTSIDDVEIGTVVGNKLYLLNYEVNTTDIQNSLPIANKMIDSFKINTMNNLADSLLKIANSSSVEMIKEKVPFLEGLFSSLSMKNLTNNPYSLLNSLGLNNTTAAATIEGLFANSTRPSSAGSFQSNLSSQMGSEFSTINPETLCSIPILSSLCRGDIFANKSFNPSFNNETSFDTLNQLFNLSNGTTTSDLLGAGSGAGSGAATTAPGGFSLSELKDILGPLAMRLLSPSAGSETSSFSTFPFLDNGSSSFLVNPVLNHH